MDFDKLDIDELLRLSIDAVSRDRTPDAMVLLKTVIERDPAHVYAIYLLAAQYAQLGMVDRAEHGFKKVVVGASSLPIARFQYGQLLMGQGRNEEAADMLAPILEQVDDLGAYARALSAAGQDRIQDSLRELDRGLELPQSIPALTIDMRRLREQLGGVTSQVASDVVAINETPAAMFLTGYGRTN
ncbi:tetratricopeptide repeat protein [Stenotrophomonas sp. 22385]|uniref:tetratricopeptide repeat protein n=1 Tax=Stenotrophomonas sp. 22385 TaxID=3453915 RepID=UPI003F8663E1